MAKKKPSALDALAKLNDERLALDARAADLKRAAALELGLVVLDAGGAELGPRRLRDLVLKVIANGPDAVLRSLSGGRERGDQTAKTKPAAPPSTEADNG